MWILSVMFIILVICVCLCIVMGLVRKTSNKAPSSDTHNPLKLCYYAINMLLTELPNIKKETLIDFVDDLVFILSTHLVQRELQWTERFVSLSDEHDVELGDATYQSVLTIITNICLNNLSKDFQEELQNNTPCKEGEPTSSDENVNICAQKIGLALKKYIDTYSTPPDNAST